MRYTADFETTTSPDDCRVWATAICEISENYKFYIGNSIDFFFDFALKQNNPKFYFHNLKFDGEFIIVWLYEHNFKLCKNKKAMFANSFNTLINDKGQFYSIVIETNTSTITIYDSLKILPFSVEEVAKGFSLPISKLELDYKADRPINHKITPTEEEYIKHDVTIMAMALANVFSQNLKQITQGSNALHDYKNIITPKRFNRNFPVLDYYIDQDIRRAYRGGFTYCSPNFKNKELGQGIVLDVNSLYPSVMYFNKLPYGEPIFFEGKYKPDEFYNLYIQAIRCNFTLKNKHIPTIQIKHSNAFIPTEYIEDSGGEDVVLYLTNVDLDLFLKHYDVYNIEYLSGWKFKSTDKLFKPYIDKWMKVKIESTLNNNKPIRTLAKLMLNALYGKFGLNPNVQSKWPVYNDGSIRYVLGEKETRNPIYIPVAAFVTAWARHKTITSAQKVYDRFLYADTDSLHLLGTDLPPELEIDSVKLGAWALESTFSRAKFIRQKTYIEEIDNSLNITCAGMPKNCYKNVTWDNFKPGSTFKGKLLPQHVKGGIVLKDIDFTIKQ